MPSGEVCSPYTHSSQTTVRYSGNASSWRKPSSHGPGRGNARATAGTSPSSSIGAARPRPSAANTASAAAAGCASAQPSAVPMKGAVHGLATMTASAPVKNEARAPWPSVRRWPAPVNRPPSSQTPENDSAIANNSSATPATKRGSCSWKPQPSCCPPARSASSTPASSRKVATTPSAYQPPCRRSSARSSAEPSAPIALIDSTGNTHGMRLRIRPPMKASSRAGSRLSGSMLLPGSDAAAVVAPAPAVAAAKRHAVPSPSTATRATSAGNAVKYSLLGQRACQPSAVRCHCGCAPLATTSGVSGNHCHCAGAAAASRPLSVRLIVSVCSATASVAEDALGRSACAAAKSSFQRESTSATRATGSSTAYSALPGMHSISQISQFAATRTGSDFAA